MKRWSIALVPFIILGALINWRVQTEKSEAAATAKQRAARRTIAPAVSVASAQIRDIVEVSEFVGSVEAPLNVKLASQITGRITFLEALEGDRVSRGQVLVRIAPSELRAQVAQRRAAVAQAQHQLEQARISQAPSDASIHTDIRQQEAALASAEAHLNQVIQNHEAQVAAAEAAVADAQGRVDSAKAAIGNAEAAIRSAQANLENARAQFKRVNDLHVQGYIAAQDVDNARTAVSVQQAAVDAARGQLNAATAQRESALAQKRSAERQVEITRTKGKADIEAARAGVTQVKAALTYARSNTARKPAYEQNLAALDASVSAAQASLENAEAMLAHTTITSPIDGFVTARNADPGAVASPGQQLLVVQAIDPVWITLTVPEEASRRIGVGQTATVTFDAISGREFTGKVTQVNTAADPVTRQFSTRVSLNNPDGLIKPGMFARVRITNSRSTSAVVVPPEAVKEGKDGSMVIVVDDGNVAHHRPVTVGARDTNGVAITKGLQAGEKVVIMSARAVRDGQEVRLGGGKGKGKGNAGAPGTGEKAPRPGSGSEAAPAGRPGPEGAAPTAGQQGPRSGH